MYYCFVKQILKIAIDNSLNNLMPKISKIQNSELVADYEQLIPISND